MTLSNIDVSAFFETDQPDVLRLTEDIFQKCILGKIYPPEAPLKHCWIGPGGGYKGQWLWDTMFVVDLLAILPDTKEIIRDVFQNYWDFQTRWNREMPDDAHGMIACMIIPGNENWLSYPAYSQIPILAWGLERVYRRNADRELIMQALRPLEEFHEWYWRERDVRNTGMVAVGSYSGDIQHARYEAFDFECNMDDLRLTPHPVRQGVEEGAVYGDICVPGNTSYLIAAERSLARLAEAMGDQSMAERRKRRIQKAVQAMRDCMWDEEAGCFLSVWRDSGDKIPVGTIGSWIPLFAGVPTEDMAAKMAATLKTSSWNTPLPVPTLDRNDPRWTSSAFWRGDVWPATNYQIASGLKAYGFEDASADLADKTVANTLVNGISEYYDSISGAKLGVEHLGMSCTVLSMMLDGLCHDHKLTVRT